MNRFEWYGAWLGAVLLAGCGGSRESVDRSRSGDHSGDNNGQSAEDAGMRDAGGSAIAVEAGANTTEPSPPEADAGVEPAPTIDEPDAGGSSDTVEPEPDAGAPSIDEPDAAPSTPAIDADVEAQLCQSSVSGTARSAQSAGFAGTEEDYFGLYDAECTDVSDCASACEAVGGEADMCGYSECLEQFDEATSRCLPAPVWRNLENIQFEGTTALDGVELTLVNSPYRDTLFTDEFELEVPADATVTGISVEIRRAGSERVADHSVKLALDQELLSSERAQPPVWTQELQWVSYGGEADLWGQSWTAEQLNAEGFGVAIALLYTQTAGNTRAYIDQVRVTVHYDAPCEP